MYVIYYIVVQIASLPETLLHIAVCELERRTLLQTSGGLLHMLHQEVKICLCFSIISNKAHRQGGFPYCPEPPPFAWKGAGLSTCELA